jgi:short-subunit dehydrogenase
LLAQQQEAALVNISSLFGLVGVPYQVPYCTTKFAVRGFTEALRTEAMDWCPQVRIHSVHPGGIKTNIARDARGWGGSEAQQQRDVARFEKLFITDPEKAAAIILRGVARGKNRILVGSDTRLPDALARLFPSTYASWIARWARSKVPNKS